MAYNPSPLASITDRNGTTAQVKPTVNQAIVMQAEQNIQQFSTSTIIEQLFKQKEQLATKTAQDFYLEGLANNKEQKEYQKV